MAIIQERDSGLTIHGFNCIYHSRTEGRPFERLLQEYFPGHPDIRCLFYNGESHVTMGEFETALLRIKEDDLLARGLEYIACPQVREIKFDVGYKRITFGVSRPIDRLEREDYDLKALIEKFDCNHDVTFIMSIVGLNNSSGLIQQPAAASA